uniref:Uncharacterized protein n=1 Tax=Panagrolaimus sp. ES5 TaxID=591445 RepID=A0AC34FZS2_9BILA
MAWFINDLISPTHTINLGNIEPYQQLSWGPPPVEFKCSGPYALKNIPFIQLSKHFCPNEAKKDRKIMVIENATSTIAPTTETTSEFLWFHIGYTVTVAFISFVVGMLVAPVFGYCCRRSTKKQKIGFINQNFPDDSILEDFDDNIDKIRHNA